MKLVESWNKKEIQINLLKYELDSCLDQKKTITLLLNFEIL